MFPVIGIVVLILLVFGGFALTGGNLGPVMHALPHEMLIIGGAAVGSLIIGNSGADLKALAGGLGKVFKGPQYKKQDYLDVILLVSSLMKMMRTEGPVAVEPHIEDPKSSPIFQQYPRLLKDSTLVHLICDTLRLVVVSSGTLDPHAVEDVMDNAVKNHHHHAMKPADGLQNLADALPALGIVAAVLGVVKTMGSIDKPPEILGGMIGSALVGTFLGVLLAYGLVGPFATRAKSVIESDGAIYHTVKQLIIASLHGHPQPLVIEAARSGVEHSNQPSFAEVFDGMRGR
ncbi:MULTISPECIES: flagellar motor stator protein MotA [Sphingopyxis]|jgi:chemotaxis protein MotA|uniref:Chemotaxis protein MotA n=2 Tax=Sphingopyxis terrae TaxID=33052 RepID=A0A1Y6ESX9_9SPHN|nr:MULTISPECIES: flagellar motor stator protein MotA [Sphingopyxis]OJW19892.1 MAG: flagellar motor stator protein MotA [Sphingopyxis sp. 65-8]AMU94864.1 flagellar motor stator protein MotA [Sphingopyxis terrae subsp. terrae NBRC 15098]ENY82185.1 flagellar motor protein MotA [Sphingopyxis sp. MC1]KAB2856836.1 MAG: flagellar motor stator protein MotA [Sphingopyxis terrae]KTE76417.1 flagellar motor stator protein MotA [Sphingopyxis sp. A083]